MLEKIDCKEFQSIITNYNGESISISMNGILSGLIQFSKLEFGITKNIKNEKYYDLEDDENFIHIKINDIKEIECEKDEYHFEAIMTLRFGQTIQLLSM